MIRSLFNCRILHSSEFFFIIGRKKVHFLVSVSSSLLFSGFCDAFNLFLLLSLALINILRLFIGEKSRSMILNYDVRRILANLRRHNFTLERVAAHNLLDCDLLEVWAFIQVLEAILTQLTKRRLLWNIQLSQSNIRAVNIVAPSFKLKFMLGGFWVPTRKDWEAMSVLFFNESLRNFPSPYHKCLSTDNRMLFMEEFKVFFLSDIK